jgi:hypothetical protein
MNRSVSPDRLGIRIFDADLKTRIPSNQSLVGGWPAQSTKPKRSVWPPKRIALQLSESPRSGNAGIGNAAGVAETELGGKLRGLDRKGRVVGIIGVQ